MAYDDVGRLKYVRLGSTTTYYAGNPSNPLQYASHGALSSMTMGNGIVVTRSYNSRLQPTSIQAGSLMTILNCYQSSDDPVNCSALPVSGNNGDVQRQVISRSGQNWTQNFQYDPLNRLSSATEAGAWSQTYGYDQYGNRLISTSSGIPLSGLTPTVISSTSNRITATINPGTINYDSRGNQTSYGSYTLSYDGDDHVSAVSGTTPSLKYEYDGEGHRVRSHFCASSSTCVPPTGAITTVYAYDAFGRLAVEYRPNAETAGTSYFTQDHLGSTRLETNSLGQPTKCSDYLPFGEEIATGYGGRSTCFNSNNNKIKFTGKERDAETGLDYFLARYYSGAQGRFLSPDEFKGGPDDALTGKDVSQPGPLPYADISNPQSLNKYVYVYNNPLRYVDPDGHDALWFENQQTGATTIVIPVYFTGNDATPKNIAAIESRAESLNTGGSSVKIWVLPTSTPVNGVLNRMDFSPGYSNAMCEVAQRWRTRLIRCYHRTKHHVTITRAPIRVDIHFRQIFYRESNCRKRTEIDRPSIALMRTERPYANEIAVDRFVQLIVAILFLFAAAIIGAQREKQPLF